MLELLRSAVAPLQAQLHQQKQLPDQIPTSGGGFAYKAPELKQLGRFLILGCDGQTFYGTPPGRALETSKLLGTLVSLNLLKEALQILESYSHNVPRYGNIVWALAVFAFLARTLEERKMVFSYFERIIRIPTHLFEFCESYKVLHGKAKWCRVMKAVISQWYSRDITTLVFQVTKYQKRSGWDHKNTLDLCRAQAKTSAHHLLFTFILKDLKNMHAKRTAFKTPRLLLPQVHADKPNEISEVQSSDKAVVNSPVELKPLKDMTTLSTESKAVADSQEKQAVPKEELAEMKTILKYENGVMGMQIINNTRRGLRELAEREDFDPSIIKHLQDDQILIEAFEQKLIAHMIGRRFTLPSQQKQIARMHEMSRKELREFGQAWVSADIHTAHGDKELGDRQFIDKILSAIADPFMREKAHWPLTESTAYKSAGTTYRKEPRTSAKEPIDDEKGEDYVVRFLDKRDELNKMTVLQTKENEAQAIQIIEELKLAMLHVPSHMLNNEAVWQSLLPQMQPAALLRNLSKLTSIGITNDGKYLQMIVNKLTDQDALIKAYINPLSVLNVKYAYDQGTGIKGKLKWQPNNAISNALESCFRMCFRTPTIKTDKRFLIGVDVSGSMGFNRLMQTGGDSRTGMSCADAAGALTSVLVNTAPYCCTMGFSNEFKDLKITSADTLADVRSKTGGMTFGATDCSLAIEYALKNDLEIDTFVIITDNETNTGRRHPHQALQAYCAKTGRNARVIMIAMFLNKFSIAKGEDMLDIAGFSEDMLITMMNFANCKF